MRLKLFFYCVSDFEEAIGYLQARIYLLRNGFHFVRRENIVLRQQLRNARLEIRRLAELMFTDH
jgi:hypothetical protein